MTGQIYTFCRICRRRSRWIYSTWRVKYCSFSHASIESRYIFLILGTIYTLGFLDGILSSPRTPIDRFRIVTWGIWFVFFFGVSYLGFENKKKWDLEKLKPKNIEVQQSPVGYKLCLNCREPTGLYDPTCKKCGTTLW